MHKTVDKFCGKPVWKTVGLESDWGKLKKYRCVKNGKRGFPQNSEKFLWKTGWETDVIGKSISHMKI